MDHHLASASSSSPPPALVGTEDALAAFISALSGAPQLPHTDGLPARFKPCPQPGCVECLAHNLLIYTNRSKAFIAPTLSWLLISEIALRLTQPFLTANENDSITDLIFQANISTLQERIATVMLSEKLLTRVRATAIALLQWHSAHYFMLGKNTICALPRLHWTQTDSDHPRVDLLATGLMVADNSALPTARRYPFIAVYCQNTDTSSLWSQLTVEQQQHWLNSLSYLQSFRQVVHRGFQNRQLPQVLSSTEAIISSDEESDEDTDDEP